MSFSGLLRVFNNIPFIKGVYVDASDFGSPTPGSETRITEEDEIRITEDGEIRITE